MPRNKTLPGQKSAKPGAAKCWRKTRQNNEDPRMTKALRRAFSPRPPSRGIKGKSTKNPAARTGEKGRVRRIERDSRGGGGGRDDRGALLWVGARESFSSWTLNRFPIPGRDFAPAPLSILNNIRAAGRRHTLRDSEKMQVRRSPGPGGGGNMRKNKPGEGKNSENVPRAPKGACAGEGKQT